MTGAKPLPVDRVHALEDLLEMYHFRDEEVLLCEAFANAVDVFRERRIKDPRIDITLERGGPDTGYINFHNNGTPMTYSEFQNYHVIAGSYKTKGGGIGFAGVGAKVFLVSKSGGEIFTITGRDSSNFLASRMFRTKDDVKYEHIYDLGEIFGNAHTHEFGTTYRVRLDMDAYQYFKERLDDIIQFWWNHALLRNQFVVTVEGKHVTAHDDQNKFEKGFAWKKNKISCYCWITKERIDDSQRHIVYSVYGKRIMAEPISQPVHLKEDYFYRVCCLADVSHLAKHIGTDKESFRGNWETNQTKQAVQKFFVNFLKNKGLLGRDVTKLPPTEITNELTKELDRLLRTKEFQDLNPFLSTKKQVPVSGDGKIPTAEEEKPPKKSGTGNGRGTDSGGGGGRSTTKDTNGEGRGSPKKRTVQGIQIIPTDQFPDEPSEAWVDQGKGAVVINTAHPFYSLCADGNKLGRLERFNITRILIDALIRFKNEELKEDWDPSTTIDKCRDLLHKTWKG